MKKIGYAFALGLVWSTLAYAQTTPTLSQVPITDIHMRWPQQRTTDVPTPEVGTPAETSPALGSAQGGSAPGSQPTDPNAVAPQPEVGGPSNEKPPREDGELQAELWAFDPVQLPRQQGMVIGQPLHHGFAYSQDPSDQRRLAEWTLHLQNEGMNLRKIEFEAQRLDRQDFEMWASRFVWWEDGLHPNIIHPDVVHETP